MASPRCPCSILVALLCAIAASAAAAAGSVVSAAGGGSARGPIGTNGRNYTKVCDAARFASLGLDMSSFGYCDASLAYGERVRDLVGRLTLEEKVSNLGDRSKGAPRVGLPSYLWWGEALHGVSDVGPYGTWFGDLVPGATSFPLVVTAAASFNETLWRAVGVAVSTEVRAMYNLGHAELTYWSPNINVVRDPRWGRASETPGEDPFLVGRYAVNFVRGMQDIVDLTGAEDMNSGDPFARRIKVSSCCKHFTAYDVDHWRGADRYTFDARVEARDLTETFDRPFEMCVRDGDASCVMCSYNRVNGVPACADHRLLTETVRERWQLHGYVVSDCDSVRVMVRYANWLNLTGAEATAAAMKAGLDLDCGMYWEGVSDFFTAYGVDAVRKGKLAEADVDNALANNYLTLMRLGFFDGSPEFEGLGAGDVCSDAHMGLAADAARQGMVLLKNDAARLPLDAGKVRSVALVGLLQHINATDVMLGDYRGTPCRVVTPYDGIRKTVGATNLHACDSGACYTAAGMGTVDATIVIAGLNMSVERESIDREDLFLPWNQTGWITAVAAASPDPIVLVIMSAGGVDVSFAQNNPKIGAIVWVGYPGEEGGTAIADVLFGKYNPGGRLPLTWFKNEYITKIPMTSMALRPDADHGYPGRTYKFYDGPDVLYPFGHGLSYTTFTYTSDTAAAATVAVKVSDWQHCKALTYKKGVQSPACPAVNVTSHRCDEAVTFTLTVANTGVAAGDHVVAVYTSPPPEVDDAPIKQLVAFRRVFVPAAASVDVPFTLNVCKAFGIVEETAYTVVPSGVSTVIVGGGAAPSLSFTVKIEFAPVQSVINTTASISHRPRILPTEPSYIDRLLKRLDREREGEESRGCSSRHGEGLPAGHCHGAGAAGFRRHERGVQAGARRRHEPLRAHLLPQPHRRRLHRPPRPRLREEKRGDHDHQESAAADIPVLHFRGDAEPGALLRGPQDHHPDGGVRALQHAAGDDLHHGGGAQDGGVAAEHAGGAGQGGRHHRLRRRLHDHALLQGAPAQGLGVPHPLALRRAHLRRARRRRRRTRRRPRRRPHHRELRRVGRMVHHPEQDVVGGVLGAVHEHDDHVPHGRGSVRGHQRGHGPEHRGLEARIRHQALLRALHRDRGVGHRVRAHVVVHPGARPAVRVHVQPAAARRRRHRRMGHPRREDTRRKCDRLRAHRRRAVHGAVGQGQGRDGAAGLRRRRGGRRRRGPEREAGHGQYCKQRPRRCHQLAGVRCCNY